MLRTASIKWVVGNVFGQRIWVLASVVRNKCACRICLWSATAPERLCRIRRDMARIISTDRGGDNETKFGPSRSLLTSLESFEYCEKSKKRSFLLYIRENKHVAYEIDLRRRAHRLGRAKVRLGHERPEGSIFIVPFKRCTERWFWRVERGGKWPFFA